MDKMYVQTIQERMALFLQSHVGSDHGWKKRAATLLGFQNAQSLYTYLIGVQLPGNALQYKLHTLGCSIDWLMFGKSITTKFGKEK